MKKNQESLQSLEQVGTISKKESSKLVRKYQKRLSKAIKERNLEQIIRTTVEAENNFGLDNDNLDKLYAIATPTYEWIIQDISEKIKEGSNVTKQQKFEFLLIRARYYFRLKRFSEQVADLVSARGIAPKARQNELDEKIALFQEYGTYDAISNALFGDKK